jgi:nondiscriminating glutamyl-tRNA synthetase
MNGKLLGGLNMTVRVRFAPSPTGYVHIGGLRTALYNYLFAKKNDGKYIMRIEDTDQTRYVEGALENLIEAMEWAGVTHDEGPFLDNGEIVEKGEYGPYIQSDRLDLYKEHVQQLIDEGKAYYCFCSKERLEEVREVQKAQGKVTRYDGFCRGIDPEEAQKRVDNGEEHVVRLKLPANKEITFNDVVRGEVTVNTNDLDDQVLMKSDGYPTYHLAVIVDDHYMKISHIIRGEEWLPSTPKHVYLYEAFGWEAPQYVHLPNILNKDRKKLSKRHGDVAVEDFRQKGYLPEGLVNYISLVGWNPEDNEEIMTMDELIEKFSLERVSKSSGVFDVDKLNWVNSHYIKQMDLDELTKKCIPYFIEEGIIDEDGVEGHYEWLKKIVKTAQESMDYLAQITSHAEIFLGEEVTLEDDNAKEMIELDHVPAMLNVFNRLIQAQDTLDADFNKKIFKMVQKETGVKGKNLYMPIRIALTGLNHGPEMVDVIEILGKNLIDQRINYTLENHCK